MNPSQDLCGRAGLRVGWLSSGGFGHTLGRLIGYGCVRKADGVTEDWMKSGRYTLEVASERVPCQIHAAALYDPSDLRVRC
ncbi:MAG: hypothetical protein IOC80_10120 [Rhodobacter sp.]|nr:hypothetical protein [Rhodobacter sp.]MCA3513715.1 hypothetical protein [Rhodobacter sp.]MCA3520746.1 hypothetical protein [Rhodobacter sp.]MCA3522837.1 hypothetical protein [Rhodobacter sp.]MCA3526249.1 hypothetical protein [Rhodobacter sp.]